MPNKKSSIVNNQYLMIEELQSRIDEMECENRKLKAEKEAMIIQLEFQKTSDRGSYKIEMTQNSFVVPPNPSHL